METSTIVTVIGVIITLIASGLGIHLMLKRRYTGQITFVREASLGLFDSIVKNLPELSVLYKEKPVGQGLVLLKGAILNNGSRDITEAMIEEKLSFNLPEGFKWLTAKVVSASPKVHGRVFVSTNKITFETGLFRCNEHIRFEALAEVPIEEDDTDDVENKLEKGLEITHRIADTKKVDTRELPNLSRSAKQLRRGLTALIFAVACAVVIIGWYHFLGWPAKTNFIITTEHNKTIEVRIVSKLDGTIKVRGVDEKYEEIVSINDFFQKEGLRPKVVAEKQTAGIIILGYIALLLFIVLWIYIEQKRARKLHKLLSIPVVNTST